MNNSNVVKVFMNFILAVHFQLRTSIAAAMSQFAE